MKIYFKEPRPATSGYGPILINYKLSRKLKKKPLLMIDYFDNIINKSKFIKNTFDKLMEVSGEKNSKEWEEEKFEEMNRVGYVYFIQNGSADQVKIGWAKNPRDRVRQLQTGNPMKLNLLSVMPAIDKGVENYLHLKYEKYRITPNGEWFHFIGKLKEFIVSRKRELV